MSERQAPFGRPVERRTVHLGRRAVVVWAMWVVSVVFVGINFPASWLGGTDLAEIVISNLVGLSFATAGAILVSRLPRNVIGWLLASGGFCFAVGNGAAGLAEVGLIVDPGSVPGAIWFAWVSNWIWAPAIGTIVGLALVYPSGRLLSQRWRPVALIAIIVIAFLTIGTASGPWPNGQFPVENPMLATGGGEAALSVLSVVVTPLAIIVAILGVASLVIRYRRSAGVERAQLKWFAAAMAISVPAFLVTSALYGATGIAGIAAYVAGVLAYSGFALLPVAIGIAVLRYRLFEIDQLISRPIGWAAVTGVLVVVFGGTILLLQAILAPLTGGGTIAVAASTLIAFSLFQPIRRRVQRLVDRRFNRARYDAERTVGAFASRLRNEVDLDSLRVEIAATIVRTVAPSLVSLWLRE